MRRRSILLLLAAGAGAKGLSRTKPWKSYSPETGSSITSPDESDSNDEGYWNSVYLLPESTAYNRMLDGDGETRRVQYFWEYNGLRSASFEVKESLYQYYKDRPRTRNFGHYASHPFQDAFLDRVLDEVAVDSTNDGYAELSSVQEFVQGLEYVDDEVATGWNEYPKYPIETLIERGGDCEDTAILMGTLLRRMGYPTILLAFWEDNHMALGVAGTLHSLLGDGTYYKHGNFKYYYVETTNTGWDIGDQPTSITSHPETIPINGYPVITATVGWSGGTRDRIEFEVTLRNVGDAVASNVRARMRVSNGVVSSPTSETFVRFLNEGGRNTDKFAFELDELPDVTVGDVPQLQLQIFERGQLHDEATITLKRA